MAIDQMEACQLETKSKINQRILINRHSSNVAGFDVILLNRGGRYPHYIIIIDHQSYCHFHYHFTVFYITTDNNNNKKKTVEKSEHYYNKIF